MAIAYKEESLPAVSTFAFDINRWAGVNKIKGSQYDYEMADCKNMSSDNFPYASPRKPREKVIDEAGIKRIYKVEDGRIYYIDKDDCICYFENGVKSHITFTDNEGIEQKILMSDCTCTNNYDSNTVFYPNMQYLNEENKVVKLAYNLTFGSSETNNTESDVWVYYQRKSAYIPIVNTEVKKFNIRMLLSEDESKADSDFSLPIKDEGVRVRIKCVFYDRFFKEKTIVTQNFGTVKRDNVYIFEISEDITLEEGDYMMVEIAAFGTTSDNTKGYLSTTLGYVSKAIWTLECADNTPSIFMEKLDYGVVYNNRIICVKGNDIRASALGDFSNFTEYADEAGNPSATGAYATDVGSAGDFTGICAYNNVLLLFKKDIVYEMYGYMPYTITELCSTGCIDNDSICSIDGVLYWASPKGIVRYSGGVPSVISTQIDIRTDGICKAGTDGRKYYVYDGYKTFVYDTYYQMWHIEDDTSVKMRYNHINDLYMVCEDGIYKVDSGKENVEWEFTTKDYTFSSKERKNLSKLWIRTEMARNSKLEIYVRQNGGEWSRVAVKTAENDEMFDFKLRVKKCDSYTIKFKGRGDVRILDIHGKVTVGTSKHRSGASLNVYRK